MEREREKESALVEDGLGLTCGSEGVYIASSFCAFDMHRGGTSGPSASEAWTVREC